MDSGIRRGVGHGGFQMCGQQQVSAHPRRFRPACPHGREYVVENGSNGFHVPGAFNLSVPTIPERPYLECHDVAWNSTGAYIAALAQHEKALKNREITLKQYEKDSAAGKKIFERRTTARAQREKDSAANKKALDDREAALAETENKRAAEWDEKMKELHSLREAAAQMKKSDAGNQVGCGSKHYKPPRKLN